MNFIELTDTKGLKHFINANNIEEIKESEYGHTIIQIPYRQIITKEDYESVRKKISPRIVFAKEES
jgi:uncharacterized protein YlzI (FlbEa/FlbD family)